MTSGTAIRAEGLIKDFRSGRIATRVLRGVAFDANHGEVTMIMGPSGSGKSTLIAALSGLLRPDAGQVNAMGQDLWAMSPTQIDRFRLAHCGFIFQGFNLFSSLTATRQVGIALTYQGLSRKAAREAAEQALDEVGLTPKAGQRPSEMSGGEKQRVAIARALAKQPQLIFADEPTSALDTENGQVVIRLLHKAAKTRGAAVVCVTHDTRLEPYADRVIHIEEGVITADRKALNPITPAQAAAPELSHA